MASRLYYKIKQRMQCGKFDCLLEHCDETKEFVLAARTTDLDALELAMYKLCLCAAPSPTAGGPPKPSETAIPKEQLFACAAKVYNLVCDDKNKEIWTGVAALLAGLAVQEGFAGLLTRALTAAGITVTAEAMIAVLPVLATAAATIEGMLLLCEAYDAEDMAELLTELCAIWPVLVWMMDTARPGVPAFLLNALDSTFGAARAEIDACCSAALASQRTGVSTLATRKGQALRV